MLHFRHRKYSFPPLPSSIIPHPSFTPHTPLKDVPHNEAHPKLAAPPSVLTAPQWCQTHSKDLSPCMRQVTRLAHGAWQRIWGYCKTLCSLSKADSQRGNIHAAGRCNQRTPPLQYSSRCWEWSQRSGRCNQRTHTLQYSSRC